MTQKTLGTPNHWLIICLRNLKWMELRRRYIHCDFFAIEDLDIASYADDNTPHTFSSELDAEAIQ